MPAYDVQLHFRIDMPDQVNDRAAAHAAEQYIKAMVPDVHRVSAGRVRLKPGGQGNQP